MGPFDKSRLQNQPQEKVAIPPLGPLGEVKVQPTSKCCYVSDRSPGICGFADYIFSRAVRCKEKKPAKAEDQGPSIMSTTGSTTTATATATTKEVVAEKQKPQHEEHSSELDIEEDIDTANPAYVKRLKRKIDVRICLVLGVLYTVSLVDRVNLPVSYLRLPFAVSKDGFLREPSFQIRRYSL